MLQLAGGEGVTLWYRVDGAGLNGYLATGEELLRAVEMVLRRMNRPMSATTNGSGLQTDDGMRFEEEELGVEYFQFNVGCVLERMDDNGGRHMSMARMSGVLRKEGDVFTPMD